MKKFIFGVALSAMIGAIAPSTSHAQAFPEGSNSISVGYGFVTILGALNSTFDTYTDINYSSLGPLYFKYERAMSDNIGLGLSVAYATNEWSYRFSSFNDTTEVFHTETTKRSTYSILARFNYHFGSSEKFDPYIGLGLGYRDANWSTTTTDAAGVGSAVDLPNLVPLGMELTFGLRYFFTDNFGAYTEIGGAKSVVQLGLSGKF